MLFNIVADMLAILIKEKEDGQVGGLVSHLIEGGVSILQYADNTILLMEHDKAKVVNMKLICCMLKQLSGPKINFRKSMISQYKKIFGCEAGALPFRYLGIPIHYRKLLNKKGIWWRLTSRGKASVLTSLRMFMLSFFLSFFLIKGFIT